MRKAKTHLVSSLSRAMLEARKQRAFTQAFVASHIGISQGALSKMERGLLVPSAIQWIEFCRLTKIKIDDFMGTGTTSPSSGQSSSGPGAKDPSSKESLGLSSEIPH